MNAHTTSLVHFFQERSKIKLPSWFDWTLNGSSTQSYLPSINVPCRLALNQIYTYVYKYIYIKMSMAITLVRVLEPSQQIFSSSICGGLMWNLVGTDPILSCTAPLRTQSSSMNKRKQMPLCYQLIKILFHYSMGQVSFKMDTGMSATLVNRLESFEHFLSPTPILTPWPPSPPICFWWKLVRLAYQFQRKYCLTMLIHVTLIERSAIKHDSEIIPCSFLIQQQCQIWYISFSFQKMDV